MRFTSFIFIASVVAAVAAHPMPHGPKTPAFNTPFQAKPATGAGAPKPQDAHSESTGDDESTGDRKIRPAPVY